MKIVFSVQHYIKLGHLLRSIMKTLNPLRDKEATFTACLNSYRCFQKLLQKLTCVFLDHDPASSLKHAGPCNHVRTMASSRP